MADMMQTSLFRVAPSAEPGPLTTAQQAVVSASLLGKNPSCVVGPPGSGKTTALVASVVARVRAGSELSKLVVLTASRPAAQQLRARIMSELGTTQRGLQVTTVHGWCLQLLHRFADAENPAPRLLSAPEQEFRVRELLAGIDPQAWPSELHPALGTRGFARQIRTILARTRQLGFDPSDLAAAAAAGDRPEWAGVANFFGEYLDVLDAEEVIDYAELVHRARLLLVDDQVRAALPEFAAHIFCDEFAELDRGMINLLADAQQAGCGLTVFADPDSSVFGFRGADPRAVADFTEHFSSPAGTPQLLQLTENLRSAPGVVAALDHIASRLPYRGIAHPAPDTPDQRVRALLADDLTSQARQIADILRHAHLADGIAWSQMAVLTRSGHNAVATIARRLAAAGVPVQVAGDEVALADELAVRQLLTAVQAAAELAETGELDDRRAARLLRSPLGGLDALSLRRLGRELRRRAGQTDPGEAVAPSERLLAEELVRPGLVTAAESGELGQLVAMRGLLAELAELVRKRADLPTILWRAWSSTAWPAQLQATALRGGENSARAHRDLDAVVALFDLAGREVSWAGAAGVRSLLAELAGQQIPADTARESDPRRQGVSVATVHRAKGEQWQLVVLTGLQDDQWPALGGASGLLRADLLGPDGLQGPQTAAEQLAAERRSLLLAASRASEQLVAIGIDDPSGEVAAPSRFIFELGVPVQPAASAGLPTTLDGLVAQLRRAASDPAAGAAVREQAARELAWLADQTDEDGQPLAPGADPAHWWTLRELTAAGDPVAPADQPIRLTGSGVESILNCPRRWFLSDQARGQQPRGTHAVLGSLVHELIARAALDGLPAASLTDELAASWPTLGFEAEWVAQAQQQVAGQMLTRFDDWALGRASERLLGVEVPFEVTVQVADEQILLVGTVDRLESDAEGRLRVIDFKTGQSARTRDEVAAMAQLGAYQLAARAGAFDRLSGGSRELTAAEVVYLHPKTGSKAVVRAQPALDDVEHTWVHDQLGLAAQIIRTENFYARLNADCPRCPFLAGCPLQTVGVE